MLSLFPTLVLLLPRMAPDVTLALPSGVFPVLNMTGRLLPLAIRAAGGKLGVWRGNFTKKVSWRTVVRASSFLGISP